MQADTVVLPHLFIWGIGDFELYIVAFKTLNYHPGLYGLVHCVDAILNTNSGFGSRDVIFLGCRENPKFKKETNAS